MVWVTGHCLYSTHPLIHSFTHLKPMWQETDNKLTRSFTFKDFREAFVFMSEVAELAETLDHHPNWCNRYNVVDIALTTHSAGNTITEKDRELAAEIDRVAKEQFNQ